MKPSPFQYAAPESLDVAVGLRAAHEDSVLLAGGQSLVPTLNFRLSNPEVVIDLRRVPGIDRIEVGDEGISVGAMVRQRSLERHEGAAHANPLVRETLGNVAHAAIRARGTIGGSVAHADPSAELPCLLLALDGHVEAAGPSGSRTIPAEELFEFIFTTSLEPDEILTRVHFPALPPRTGWSFQEFARRHGDFALAGVAATITLDGDGTVVGARLAACGVSTRPVRLAASEAALLGRRGDRAAFQEAAREAGEAVTLDDGAGSATYQRHILGGLMERALTTAAERTEADR